MSIIKPEIQEKRSFTRYPVKDNSAAMLTPGNIISFCIIDMSKTGMAFCYNGRGNERKLPKNQVLTLFTEGDVSLEISAQIISDIELDEEDFPHSCENRRSSNLYLRRCGIKFMPSSQDQEDSINEYIQYLKMNLPKFNGHF